MNSTFRLVSGSRFEFNLTHLVIDDISLSSPSSSNTLGLMPLISARRSTIVGVQESMVGARLNTVGSGGYGRDARVILNPDVAYL